MRIYFIFSFMLCAIHLHTAASQSTADFKAKLKEDVEALRKKQAERMQVLQKENKKRFEESISLITASNNEVAQQMARDLTALEQKATQAQKDSDARIAQMNAEHERQKRLFEAELKKKEEMLHALRS